MLKQLSAIFVLCIGFGSLSACGSSVAVAQPTATMLVATATATAPTNTPTATATTIAPIACTGTKDPNSILQIQNVPFPSSTVVDNLTEGAGDGVANSTVFHNLDLCTQNSMVSAVQTFFATQMPAKGCSQSAVFPYNNDISSACGDPYCWKLPGSSSKVTFYVSLEQVKASGSNVTYLLRYDVFDINS